MFAEGGYE